MTVPMTEATPVGAPALSRLLGSEVLRARSRRALIWLPLSAVAGLLVIAGLFWVNSASVTQADLDAAGQQHLAQQEMYYQDCLKAEANSDMCWKPSLSPEEAIWVLDKPPFGNDEMQALIAFAGGLGVVVALMLSASAGGADWGARTMGLLLSWEPRRRRVFATRLLVVIAVALALEALLVGVALGVGSFIAADHGLVAAAAENPAYSGFVPDPEAAREMALRWLPLSVLGAAAGYAVAMATRSTGWAIGASIGFVAVVESVIRAVSPWASQWLIQTNLAAWLSGGMKVLVDPAAQQVSGSGSSEMIEVVGSEGHVALFPGEVWISGGRALATLAAFVVLLIVVSLVSFTRRDVD